MDREQTKIDVVIPTILNTLYEVFSYTLEQLQDCDRVNKIIVIDNTGDQSFKLNYTLNASKIEVINGHKLDLYVNGSWNLGVEHCTAEYYCLLNDDILASAAVIEKVVDTLDRDRAIKLVTVKTVNNMLINKYKLWVAEYDELGTFRPITTDIPNSRQGWFMAGRVNQWEPVPEQLRLFYGDDWIYKQLNKTEGDVVMLLNTFISHFQSSSVNRNFDKLKPIMDADERVWIAMNDR